jgi:hypothetical protein
MEANGRGLLDGWYNPVICLQGLIKVKTGGLRTETLPGTSKIQSISATYSAPMFSTTVQAYGLAMQKIVYIC